MTEVIKCTVVVFIGVILVLLVATMARAADYAPVPAPVYDWTGVYIGGAVGWGVEDQVDFRVVEDPYFVDSHQLDGVVFGGQIGGRIQVNALVAGIELQGFGGQIEGGNEVSLFGPYSPKLHTGTEIDSLVLAKAKLGVALDRWMIFGTVGWANAGLNPHASLNLADIYVPVQECSRQCGGGAAKFSWQDDRRGNGVVFGAGLNYAVSDNIVVGVEWNHVDLDEVTFSGPVKFQGINLFPAHARSDFDIDIIMGTLSFNLPFGGGAGNPLQQ